MKHYIVTILDDNDLIIALGFLLLIERRSAATNCFIWGGKL
jgi:hypothetical protein